MRTLVLVHGRSQEGRRDDNLKRQWLDALQQGLERAGLSLDVPEDGVRFPFYGDVLADITSGRPTDDVVVLGDEMDAAERAFIAEAVVDAVQTHGIGDDEIRAQLPDGEVVELGPQNWPWVLAALRVLEKIPGAGSAALAIATRDVYHYLRNPGVQTKIETGVRKAFDEERECVVVGHSLGSVVAYSVLRRRSPDAAWSVPSFITVGSPLAVRPIVEALSPIGRPPGVVDWLNAYDPRDVVSLHPLDAERFPVRPEVRNHVVDNDTPNRHGISGYLSDPVVARAVHDALLA